MRLNNSSSAKELLKAVSSLPVTVRTSRSQITKLLPVVRRTAVW